MSDHGIKQDDEHLRDRDEGGDDEVRAGLHFSILASRASSRQLRARTDAMWYRKKYLQ